jgi:hypothetical protein
MENFNQNNSITLERPSAGQRVTIKALGPFILNFSIEDVALVQDGDDLVFQFNDGSAIILVGGVNAAASGEAMELKLPDGTMIELDNFLKLQGAEIEPAAGPGLDSSGSGEYSDDPGRLYDGINPLDPIGNVNFVSTLPPHLWTKKD